MSKIRELFDTVFRNILLNLTEDEILIFLLDMQAGTWLASYKKLVEKMSTSELCELQDTINAEFVQANARNANLFELQQRIIIEALSSWLLGYKSAIVQYY